MPEYVLGFRELAERLGRDLVGEPLEDEERVAPWLAVQFTSQGMMVYSGRANRAGFVAFSRGAAGGGSLSRSTSRAGCRWSRGTSWSCGTRPRSS